MRKNIKWILLLIVLMGVLCISSCGNTNNEELEKSTDTEKIMPDTEVISTEEMEQATEKINEVETEDLEKEIKALLKKEWKDKYAPEVPEKFAEYIEGYDGYLALIKVDGDKMKISSSNYDGDAKDSFVVREVKIAENVTYSDLSIKTVINDEGEKVTDTYKEITKEDMEIILDSTLGVGFVWFNEDMEIEKVMFYGELMIWE